MDQDKYYLRVRGRISGPFTGDALQTLVRRGGLSRIHEISADRVNWGPAGAYEELFPSMVAEADPEPVAVEEEVFMEEEDQQSRIAPPLPAVAPGGLFFYTQRGSTVGPVPMAVLRVLVQNGTVGPDDLVWRENAETGAPACQMPALAPLFGQHLSPQVGYASNRQPGNISRSSKAIAAADKASKYSGISAGVSLLVLLNLPWMQIEKKFIFWWDVFQAGRFSGIAAFLCCLVLAGIALCIVSPLLSGAARAITHLSLVGFIVLYYIVISLEVSPPGELIISISAIIALAMLIGICAVRSDMPGAAGPRIWQGVCGSIATAGMLLALIEFLQTDVRFNLLPSGVVALSIFAVIGVMAGLAAGITAVVGFKPLFTSGLNLSTRLTSYAALVSPAVGILICCASLNSGDAQHLGFGNVAEIMFEFFARIIGMAFAILLLLSAALRELLVNVCDNPD